MPSSWLKRQCAAFQFVWNVGEMLSRCIHCCLNQTTCAAIPCCFQLSKTDVDTLDYRFTDVLSMTRVKRAKSWSLLSVAEKYLYSRGNLKLFSSFVLYIYWDKSDSWHVLVSILTHAPRHPLGFAFWQGVDDLTRSSKKEYCTLQRCDRHIHSAFVYGWTFEKDKFRSRQYILLVWHTSLTGTICHCQSPFVSTSLTQSFCTILPRPSFVNNVFRPLHSLGKPKRSITRPMSAEQAGYSFSNKFTPVI